jgi:hypothetical protein
MDTYVKASLVHNDYRVSAEAGLSPNLSCAARSARFHGERGRVELTENPRRRLPDD